MYFFVTQPDSLYFTWQIELFLYNLIVKNEYPQNYVHILFGYNPNIGISFHAKRLKKIYPQYHFFFYADTRKFKEYSSTIRPHIIEKHFRSFPELRSSAIFYVDSDIIFRSLPNLDILLNDNEWYASNTQHYLSYKIIINSLGINVFKEMCHMVGINIEDVINNDNSVGGAQYILKNIPEWFWLKVEKDSVNIYKYLYNILYYNTPHNFFEKKIDIWFTEMWVVFWNSILAKKTFKIHEELNFCWANDPIEKWHKTKILHYSGVKKIETNIFDKQNFTYYKPFYSNLLNISNTSASFEVVKLINEYRHVLDNNRVNLTDTLLIINHSDISQNIETNITYINKYLNVKIIVLDTSINQKDILSKQHDNVYYLRNTNIKECMSTISQYINDFNIKFIINLKQNIIIPISLIIQTISKMKKNISVFVLKPKVAIYKMDVVTRFTFNKIINYKFLISNINKMNYDDKISTHENIIFINNIFLDKFYLSKILCHNDYTVFPNNILKEHKSIKAFIL